MILERNEVGTQTGRISSFERPFAAQARDRAQASPA